MRERDWCNVITAHEGETAAYTWLLKNYSLGALLELRAQVLGLRA